MVAAVEVATTAGSLAIWLGIACKGVALVAAVAVEGGRVITAGSLGIWRGNAAEGVAARRVITVGKLVTWPETVT